MSWYERRDAGCDENIVAESGAVFETEAEVGTDAAVDVVLERESFEDSGVIKPQKVGVGDGAELWCDFKVHTGIEESDARVHEVTLSLELAAAKICEEAFALCEIHTEEFDLLALPEAELSAGEIWIIEHSVEAFGVLVIGIIISGGPEAGGAEANPVAVDREFECSHVCPDICGLSLNWIESIATGDVIEGVADIDTADMAIPCEAKIEGIDFVRSKDAGGIRPDKKVIAVEFNAGLVVVVVKAELRSVTRKDEVLTKVVENDCILVAVIEGIQEAVGFLFGLVEPDDVKLIPVGKTGSEESYGAIGVGEDKATEVAHKWL